MNRPAALALASLLVSLPSLARAEGSPAPAPNPAATAGHDEVRLRDGALYRGRIIELVPKDHVVLVLATTGEAKRFAMSEVTYAGPEEPAAPSPIAPAAPASPTPDVGSDLAPYLVAPSADVRFEADDPHVSFYVKTATARIASSGIVANGFAKICTPPCTAAMPVGRSELAAGVSDTSVVSAEHPLDITGSGTVTGQYYSRAGLRIAGVVTIITGSALGLGLMLASPNLPDGVNSAFFAGGLGLLAVGTLVGSLLMLQDDKLELSFVPFAAPSTGAAVSLRREGSNLVLPSSDAYGGALRVGF